ncbi:hypothetical protein HPP92_009012 [Vanilla planifolia]|uniref:Uncharacterized protein n=1 Tax=Vanilla planifolia TaxID=51239 RepID=A0A835RIX3_VANPL|nr:hypothetical protein HPP92_009012 [Vanilla planifolia]
MTEAMKKVKQLTSNALAIVGAASKFVSMAGLYRVDSINVAEVRVNKLEENSEDEAVSFNPDNGMPTWLTEETRRHLKEQVSTPKNNLKSVILSRIAAGLHRVVGALTNSSAKVFLSLRSLPHGVPTDGEDELIEKGRFLGRVNLGERGSELNIPCVQQGLTYWTGFKNLFNLMGMLRVPSLI